MSCLRIMLALSLLLTGAELSVAPAVAQAWGPANVHVRLGVVHDSQMSLVRMGGMLGYLSGGSRGSAGSFWVLGPAANFCLTAADLKDGSRDYYQGWSLGPEVRLGWAWGQRFRKAAVHVGFQPYFLQMWADSGAAFVTFGLRSSLGVAYGHKLFARGLEDYLMPNHIELVADIMQGGPFGNLTHWGLSFGWEY